MIITPYTEDYCPVCGQKCTGASADTRLRPTKADFAWAVAAVDKIEAQRACEHSLTMLPEFDSFGVVKFCLDCGASLMECGHTDNDLIDGSPPWCYLCDSPPDKLEAEIIPELRIERLELEIAKLNLRCAELELAAQFGTLR